MQGYVTFKGKQADFSTTGSIPFAAVKVFLEANPSADVDDVWDTFRPGVVGKGENTKYPFIIAQSDWSQLSDQTRHYKETLSIGGVPYRVSKQFGYDERGIIPFEKYLSQKKPGDKFTFVYEATTIPGISVAPVPHGMDSDCYHVRYADGISGEKKIPGLCAYLEEEYEGILGMAKGMAKKLLESFAPDRLIRIPVILSDKTPTDRYTNDDKKIADMLHRQVQIYGRDLSRKKILEILKLREMKCSRAGEYHHSGAPVWKNFDVLYAFDDGSEPYIVIYYNNISGFDWEKYKAEIAQCLAHEYMHFLNDMYAGAAFGDTTVKAKAVKESLADFFSVLYSVRTADPSNAKAAVAEERYNIWDDYFGSSWPYANALWYYFVGGKWLPFTTDAVEYRRNCCIDKFMRVFEASRDMKKAYGLLTE